MVGALKAVAGHVPLGPIEIGVREIDRHGRDGLPRRRIDSERTRVGEQVQEAPAGGQVADQPAGDAVVEKEAGVEVIRQVHLELQSAFAGHEQVLLRAQPLVFRRAPLPSRFFKNT